MKDDADALFGLLGLAQRAGALKSGETAVQAALSGRHAVMVLVDCSSSENTKKRYMNACEAANTPLAVTPEGLGDVIGKSGRMVCALTDAGFKPAIERLVDKVNAH